MGLLAVAVLVMGGSTMACSIMLARACRPDPVEPDRLDRPDPDAAWQAVIHAHEAMGRRILAGDLPTRVGEHVERPVHR